MANAAWLEAEKKDTRMIKSVRWRRIGYYVILSGFLLYGAVRMLGALPGFTQSMGWTDTQIGRQIVQTLESALPAMSEQAILPMSVPVYIGWSALMGFLLTSGSLLALAKKRAGHWLMASYFVLFGAGFLNYLVVNVKLLHFAAGLLLFLLMLWLSDRRSTANQLPAD